MDLKSRAKVRIYASFLFSSSEGLGGSIMNSKSGKEKKKQLEGFGFCTEQRTERSCSHRLISDVPSLRRIPCSTSAWESRDTRSDIAQSRPADGQFSY